MWGIEDLKTHREIIDRLDWEMTPERAVETYLEWGTGWARRDQFVRFADQQALYFVIYDWEKPPQVTLIRRTMKEADEIAKIPAPADMVQRAIKAGGRKPGVGVYAITEELEQWLKEELGA
ncbi:MAG: DVU0772 family protein [Syntrophobacteraceae bacterium]